MSWSRVLSGAAIAIAGCTPASPAPRFTAADESAVRSVYSAYLAAMQRDYTTRVINTHSPDPIGRRPSGRAASLLIVI